MENELQMQTVVQETPGLQQMYIATHHWLDDMLFFDDEARFLNLLLAKYFTVLLHDEYINRIQLINDNLKRVVVHKQIIKDEVLTHQNNLNNTLKNNTPHREDFLNLEHDRLEEEIKDMHRRFKNVKSDIFRITELTLMNNKLNAHAN